MHPHPPAPSARRRGALAIALLVTAVLSTPAAATPLKCRRTISKAGAAFAQAKLKALRVCEDAILLGKIAGPCPDSKAGAKIAKLRAKLNNVISVTCGGLDKNCGVGTDDEPLPAIGWSTGVCPDIADSGSCLNTIADCSGASECVRCIDEMAVGATLDLAFRAFTPNTLSPAIRKCQRAIGKESAQFVASEVRALQKCEDRVLQGKTTGPCPDSATFGRLTKMRTKLQQNVCKVCGGDDKVCGGIDLTPAEIGFVASCPDVVVPGGPACGGAIATLTDLVTCLDCVGRQRALCMDRIAAPGINSYPDECNGIATPTPSATATVTASTTPTATVTATTTATTTPSPTTTATPTPTLSGTPTPTPTATPSSVTVKFDLTSSQLATSIALLVTYPTGAGSFAGSGAGVSCTTSSLGVFSPNDDDTGNLTLSVSVGALTFPFDFTCTFDLTAGQTLVPNDLGISVTSFMFGVVALDPSLVNVTTQVLP